MSPPDEPVSSIILHILLINIGTIARWKKYFLRGRGWAKWLQSPRHTTCAIENPPTLLYKALHSSSDSPVQSVTLLLWHSHVQSVTLLWHSHVQSVMLLPPLTLLYKALRSSSDTLMYKALRSSSDTLMYKVLHSSSDTPVQSVTLLLWHSPVQSVTLLLRHSCTKCYTPPLADTLLYKVPCKSKTFFCWTASLHVHQSNVLEQSSPVTEARQHHPTHSSATLKHSCSPTVSLSNSPTMTHFSGCSWMRVCTLLLCCSPPMSSNSLRLGSTTLSQMSFLGESDLNLEKFPLGDNK